MQQLRLLHQHQLLDRTVSLDQIKATFKKAADDVQEVVLEINSHKFLINIKAGLQSLERFEVIAVKGLVELGVKFLRLLKRIVTVLYFEY